MDSRGIPGNLNRILPQTSHTHTPTLLFCPVHRAHQQLLLQEGADHFYFKLSIIHGSPHGPLTLRPLCPLPFVIGLTLLFLWSWRNNFIMPAHFTQLSHTLLEGICVVTPGLEFWEYDLKIYSGAINNKKHRIKPCLLLHAATTTPAPWLWPFF